MGRFFRKYAGGTLTGTLPLSIPVSGVLMKKNNLNVELREWLSARLKELLGEKQENIHHVEFNVHEAKEMIIRSFYDYQAIREWPSIAKHTGEIVGYDESAIRKFFRRKH